MREASNADLIRKNITILEESIKTRLDESGFLLEMQTSVNQQLIPALKEMFEHYGLLMEQEAAPGEYSDEEILALVRHFGSIKKLIDAHKEQPSTGVDSAVVADADKNEKAIQTARRAIGTIITNADSNSPVVRDPAAFVADKNERLVSSVEAADRDGKFKNLVRIVKTWPSLAKNRKVANLLTVSTGVLIPLLSSGTWWAAPAAMMIVKTVFDRMQGQSWKQAVAKNVSVGAIASLIGFGAARASNLDQMVADFSQWAERPGDVPGYRGDSSVVGSQTSGEAGDYAPSNRGGRSFPGEVGYDQPDRTGQQQAATSTTKQQIDNKLDEPDEPGEAGSDDARGAGGPYFPGEAGSDDARGAGGPYFPGEAGSDDARGAGGPYFPGDSNDDTVAQAEQIARGREFAEFWAKRMERVPDDVHGWRRLARVWDSIGEPQKGDEAWRRVMALELNLEPNEPMDQNDSPAQEYTVQRGDNLSTLAQKNNISVRELMAANPQITNPDQLRTGETINIPSETGSKTYDQGVGTRSDTQAGLRSGRFTNRQGFS